MRNWASPYWLMALLACFLISCREEVNQQARVTVVVYMAADNNLQPFAGMDCAELEAVRAQMPRDCRLVVWCDTTSQSTDTLHIATTLHRLFADHPAQHYGLVLWSHGRGWLGWGLNRDEQRVPIPALRRVMGGLPHLDWLLMDACHMACMEVVYELQDVADYIIASPAEIPGTGAPYDRLSQALFSTDARQAALAIAEGYFDYYSTREGGVVSVVETALLDDYVSAITPLLREVCHSGSEPELFYLQRYTTYCAESDYLPNFYDMGSAMHSFGVSVEAQSPVIYFQATDVWATTSPYIFHQMLDRAHSIGLSLFIPSAAYRAEHIEQYLTQYAALSWYPLIR